MPENAGLQLQCSSKRGALSLGKVQRDYASGDYILIKISNVMQTVHVSHVIL